MFLSIAIHPGEDAFHPRVKPLHEKAFPKLLEVRDDFFGLLGLLELKLQTLPLALPLGHFQ